MARILVGIDGSKAAESALEWAGRWAQATGDGIVVFHAQRRPYSEMSPSDQADMLAERAAVVRDRWVAPLADLGVALEVDVVEGDVRESLSSAADRVDAELLVLGRTGAGGGPGLLHLGSVAEHVAHHADRPLAVVPTGDGGPIRRIVVGVDGSAESAAAVRWVARLASAIGADVVAAIVEEPVAEWTPSWDEKNWRRDVEREFADWLEPLTAHGVEAEQVILEQLHPADGLLATAEEHDADLLVVGTRGSGGFTGLRFGGVAMKLLHHAELPLVLVPPTTGT